jgi:hypothetical protein
MHGGKILVAAGIVLIIAGLIWWFADDKLQWFGKLPGDIRYEKPGFSFYMPVTTMILLSLLLSLGIYMFRKFF